MGHPALAGQRPDRPPVDPAAQIPPSKNGSTRPPRRGGTSEAGPPAGPASSPADGMIPGPSLPALHPPDPRRKAHRGAATAAGSGRLGRLWKAHFSRSEDPRTGTKPLLQREHSRPVEGLEGCAGVLPPPSIITPSIIFPPTPYPPIRHAPRGPPLRVVGGLWLPPLSLFFPLKGRKSLPSLPSPPNRAASMTWPRGAAFHSLPTAIQSGAGKCRIRAGSADRPRAALLLADARRQRPGPHNQKRGTDGTSPTAPR